MSEPQLKSRQKQIAIFASGAGSNAQKIIDHFRHSDLAAVALIVCNNRYAGVLGIAEKENIPILLLERKRFNDDGYIDELKKYHIDLIVLAGFLWMIPPILISAYSGRIINIHPALLPKYGGRNMYGRAVHEAVLASHEKVSGITIHYVDELYDHGKIIVQKTCEVDSNDTADSLAERVHKLEHRWYPETIEKLLAD